VLIFWRCSSKEKLSGDAERIEEKSGNLDEINVSSPQRDACIEYTVVALFRQYFSINLSIIHPSLLLLSVDSKFSG